LVEENSGDHQASEYVLNSRGALLEEEEEEDHASIRGYPMPRQILRYVANIYRAANPNYLLTS